MRTTGRNEKRRIAELRTDRLLLRLWTVADSAPFAAMNADEDVARYLAGPVPRRVSDELVTRIRNHFEQYGFGVWAVEVPDKAKFIGFVGLMVPRFDAHFTPCVEIGWRLARRHWGRGYATEAARAALEAGFGRLGFDEIVALTVPANTASRRVMEKLGMSCDRAGDFEHPLMPEGHPLRRHLLYRLTREEYALIKTRGSG